MEESIAAIRSIDPRAASRRLTHVTALYGFLKDGSSGRHLTCRVLFPTDPRNNRLYLGGDEESFLAEVEWQHDRLKRAEQVVPAEFEPGSLFESSHRSANHGITSAASVGGLAEDRDDRIGTRGTFVAFSGYDNASKARDLLAEAFSPQSVAVLAHSRRYGTGFLVHASPVGVDALLESYAERAEVLESLFAMPPSLKIAPSLLNHVGEASAAAGTVGRALRPGEADTSTHPSETYLSGDKRGLPPEMHPGGHGEAQKLTTLPGKVFHKDGLALYLSPGAVPAGAEKEVVERWRREWQSKNLNLRDIFFWSDRERREQAAVTAGAQLRSEQGGKSLTKEGRRGAGAEDLSGSSVGAETDAGGASLLAREWGGAVRIVHAMAERYGGSPAEACGWDRVRVARESPGLITVRGEKGHW